MRQQVQVDNLFLNVSTVCNMRCRRCYGHLESFQNARFMDFTTAKRATDLYFGQRNADCISPYIMLFGGEPLLNWALVESYVPWVRSNFRQHYDLYLFTNGLALTEEKIRFLVANHVQLFVSLDGDYRQHRQTRPVSEESFQHILSMVRYARMLEPEAVIPYCVIRKQDLHAVPDAIAFLSSVGLQHIALSRDLAQHWEPVDRLALAHVLAALRKEGGVDLAAFPETTCDCFGRCYPRSMMVYPDGEIYDLCYVSATLLFGRGLISHEDTQVMHMGNLGTTRELSLDVEKKRSIVRAHMECALAYSRPIEPRKVEE